MPQPVVSEMAANVWRVLVSPGDTVTEDQPLMILESMKMEIPVVSEGGTVAALHVAEGDNVAEGQLLLELS